MATLLFTARCASTGASAAAAAPLARRYLGILGQNRRFTIYLLGFALYGLGFLMGLPLFAIVQVDRLAAFVYDDRLPGPGAIAVLAARQYVLGPDGRSLWRHVGAARQYRRSPSIVPLTYSWAFNAWTLLPAFIAHGIISAGMDLALISSGIELADPRAWPSTPRCKRRLSACAG